MTGPEIKPNQLDLPAADAKRGLLRPRIMDLILLMIAFPIVYSIEEFSFQHANSLMAEADEEFRFAYSSFGWLKYLLMFGLGLGLAGCWLMTWIHRRRITWHPAHGLIAVTLLIFAFSILNRVQSAMLFASSDPGILVNISYFSLRILLLILFGLCALLSRRFIFWCFYFAALCPEQIVFVGQYFFTSKFEIAVSWMTPGTFIDVFHLLVVGFNGLAMAMLFVALVIDVIRKQDRDWIHYVAAAHAIVFLHVLTLYDYLHSLF